MKKSWVAGVILILAVAAQIAHNWNSYFLTMYPRIMNISTQSARNRAGILSREYDEDDVRFFQFLRTKLPLESTLIIPAAGKYGEYRFKHLIEYHLFPLDIESCRWPIEKYCPGLSEWKSHSIMKIADFPPEVWIENQKSHHLIEFNNWLGVMVPIDSGVGTP
jgi:hypothetical protein